jgi:NADH-quinone oxidoreductase subunit J
LFYFFVIFTISAALFLAITKNIVHAAFSLLFVLLGVAALFIFAGAEFAAMTQIMIYIGGVLILIIFGVMLTSDYMLGKHAVELNIRIPAIIISVGIVAGLIYCFSFLELELRPSISYHIAPAKINNTQQIGYQLMTNYILPFEASGILLMVALIGAAMIAGNKTVKN